MNAEVTAENKPACKLDEHTHARATRKAYEDQGVIQVCVVFRNEPSVVFCCIAVIHLVKLGPFITLGLQQSLLPAVCGLNDASKGRT